MMIQGGEEAARHAAHPGLLARIAPRGGDAGIARAAITLPLAQQLDPARLGSVCPATALSPQSRCPALGSVSMRSPALAKPLRGELFMRSSKHRFPDLVAELGGEVDLELDARMSFAGGRVRIVFDSLPDVPLSRLSLAFDGGQRGILLNTRDLCASPALAAVELDAQNGREWQGAVPLRVGCG
jgi:hypothetical protein